jgi:2,5-diketo-D-gluconate reductase A
VLSWHIQRGDVVFPKSATPQRITQNSASFNFELSDADAEAISALDEGEAGRIGPNADTFDLVED